MNRSQTTNYTPEIEHGDAIARSFQEFGQSQLSDSTLIHHVTQEIGSRPVKTDLTLKEDISSLACAKWKPRYDFFFIYKYLVQDLGAEAPPDANKLRISEACFEALADRLMIPAAFVFALSRYFLPNGRGSRRLKIDNEDAFDFWYFLPIRVQVPAGTPPAGISDDPVSTSQMNPFHKLPLPGAKVDIRRSCVGIFSRIEPKSQRITFLAFDFMHGGWPKVALEPSQRIEEAMKQRRELGVEVGYGYFIHLVYLSSAARWWTNALNSIHEQLLFHELDLQKELDGELDGDNPAAKMTQINRALHSIAAHLHRYLSELKSLQGVVVDLVTHYESVYDSDSPTGHVDEHFETASRGFSQVLSQIEATHDFAQELEKKVQNILALLFNRIQINSANLNYKVAEASRTLAEEMKRDSVAMRTIAVVTMFFLPGATFAALLSMPFFNNDKWFSDLQRIWLWFLLTVPSTATCFIFYRLRGGQRIIG